MAYAVGLVALRHRRRAYVLVACLCAAVLAWDGVLLSKYFQAVSSDRESANSAWSPATYQLGRDRSRRTRTGIYRRLWHRESASYVASVTRLQRAYVRAGVLAHTAAAATSRIAGVNPRCESLRDTCQ